MAKNFYQPSNNYERNIVMVKSFGGRLSVLMLPILLFLSIVCSCYMNIKNEPHLEIIIIKVVTSKLNFEPEFGGYETLFLMVKILLMGFFIYIILYIFFKSKNNAIYETPDLGYRLIHKVSIIELLISVVCFIGMTVIIALFIFGSAERFEFFGRVFFLTVEDIKAYKVTISVLLILFDVILFLLIWFFQSQTDFMKSVMRTLEESVPQNKGAHTYGVFSMVLSIVFATIAVIITFMYYCYEDAFSGFGLSVEKTYVYISLASLYLNALVPFFLAVNAFAYSARVDELNAIGTVMYSNYDVMGDAEDPNMRRAKSKSNY